MDSERQISNGWFYKLYGIYGGVFLFICAAAIASCYLDFHIQILIPAALLLIALLLIFFVASIKRGVLQVFDACGSALDQAMEGQMPIAGNDETELASFQAKLARFVSMKEKSFRDARDQREQIETLLADISHQTKTPISNILLYSQLLAEKSGENKELIRKLVDQSEKLKSLIQTLVEMSRLENGIIRCVPERQNVRDFLLQVMGDYYDRAQAKKMNVLLDCPDKTTAVFDRKWMREAVGNLVDNAIKYTPEKGEIKISAVSYEMFVRIGVTDTGAGIREEEQAKVFGRFYRSRRTAGCEGLGLGLYLAREMVTAQRGYMKVLSEPGKGSSFYVYIPGAD